MSYDNAYIPILPGLNMICGPNGAGKSSILLGLSVVLGQIYTERARRLSDLIRWNASEARITLHLQNQRNGSRLFPTVTKDTAAVTRVLRRNGEHYYLLQGRPVSKSTVAEAFSRIGLNPDNLLIVMHQLMVGRFATISPPDKLRMLEEAVGFQSYRSEVLEAYERLKKVQGEEQSLASILQSTKETFDYWRREYERLLRKRDLESKILAVQREIAWAKVARKEASIAAIASRIDSKKRIVDDLEKKSYEVQKALSERDRDLSRMRQEHCKVLEDLIKAAKLCAKLEGRLAAERTNLEWLRSDLNLLSDAGSWPDRLGAVVDVWRKRVSELEGCINMAQKELDHSLDLQRALGQKFQALDREIQSSISALIQDKVQSEVLDLKRKMIHDDLTDLEVQLKIANDELTPMVQEAEGLGPRVNSPRKILELTAELSALQEQIKPIAHLSQDVEKIYFSYSDMFKDLKGKAELVAANRSKVLEELRVRMDKWRSILISFLEELSRRYEEILRAVEGTGHVRLSDAGDINNAGLEIFAGFRGNQAQLLDSFSQSGGERSIALMAFLLALQQNILSPLRAVDEFDVHLDPRNRDAISMLITATARKAKGVQYVAITPGHVTPEEGTHVIVVQRIGGVSQISEV